LTFASIVEMALIHNTVVAHNPIMSNDRFAQLMTTVLPKFSLITFGFCK